MSEGQSFRLIAQCNDQLGTMISACTVTSRDLLQAILSSPQKSGWFGGLELTSENLYLALKCVLEGREVFTMNRRLTPHKAGNLFLGDYRAELVQWLVVSTELSKELGRPQVISQDDYQQKIGLQIPDKQIIFCAIASIENEPVLTTVLARKLRNGQVQLRPADSIIQTDDADPFRRISKELVDELKTKTVMIIGTGSGGCEIALNLACVGIGSLELVDPDRLRPENYIRFGAGKEDLGRYKVEAVKSMIAERELQTKVGVHHLNVVAKANEFRGILSDEIDLLICATDTVSSRRLVNCAAVGLNLPCVIAGTLNHGKIGEILRVSPYQFPCYECVRLELGAALEPPDSDGRASSPYLERAGEEFLSAASRMDVVVPSAIATRVALEVLAPMQFPPVPAPYIVWGREADLAFSVPFQFDLPLTTNFVSIQRRKDCAICGVQPADLVGVDVPQKAIEILSEADRASQ